MNEMVTSGVLGVLADPRLLTPERFAELSEHMYPLCPDWQILGPEIVYRGWLTKYQMHQILEGHGRDLVLGSYVLLDQLGEGGMGRVFSARNWKLNKVSAVKVIRSDLADNDAMARRFQREILALGQVTHSNIVHAFDAGADGNRLYYAMEYVSGIDLGRLVQRDGPLGIAAACYYVAQTAQALGHAHQFGVVHRDVKPSNLLLDTESHTIKLLDLGLARFDAPDGERMQLTRVGSLVGTPDYVAPEQIRDPHNVDIRSDLYSLGCTFYYLLTGQAPFEKEETVDKLYCHVREDPVAVERLRPQVPPELAAIVHKLMAKEPERRFQEPIELIDVLLPFVSLPELAESPTVANNGAPTLREVQPIPEERALPPTQIVSVAELGFVPPEEAPATEANEEREPPQRQVVGWVQTAIAMVLALGALIWMWKSGWGPSGGSPSPPAANQIEAEQPLP